MAEYISREETVKAFCEKCKGYYDGHCIHRGECDIDVIKTAPSANVQPVNQWQKLTAENEKLKRILKNAMSDIYKKCSCDNFDCDICEREACDYDDRFTWRLEEGVDDFGMRNKSNNNGVVRVSNKINLTKG